MRHLKIRFAKSSNEHCYRLRGVSCSCIKLMVSLPGLLNLYSATQPKKTMINYMSHAPDNVYTELYPVPTVRVIF